MSFKKTSVNAISSTIQVIITGISFFLLYKYLLNTLGSELLGVWSLILSTSSIANLANFGLTSGIVKYVAEYIALDNQQNIKKLVFTSIVTIGCLFVFISILIMLVLPHFMHYFIESKFLKIAISILPFSLISLILNAVGGIYTSTLEGFQKNYIRNIIYSFGMLIFVFLCILLAPIYSLIGIAYAQVAQSMIVIIFAYLSYKHINKQSNSSRNDFFAWNTDIFKTLLSYGSKFQLISVSQMFYDPITKIFISKFAGVQSVAFYEMANRLVSQLRGLIIAANQVMIPVIATAATEGKFAVKTIYRNTMGIITFISVPLITIVTILAPLITYLWIGNFNKVFLIFLYLQLIVSLLHLLNGPAYFGLLGEGNLNGMLKISLIELIVNAIMGFSFSLIIPQYGAAIGSAITVITATIAMTYMYQKIINVKMNNIFNSIDILFYVVGFVIIIMSILLYFFYQGIGIIGICKLNITLLILFLLIFIPLMFKDSRFKKIKKLFSDSLI